MKKIINVIRNRYEALQSGAHLTELIRTRVGDVRLEDCLDPEHFKEWIDRQEIENDEDNN